MDDIKIKNVLLRTYIEACLNKGNINKEDLKNVKEIILDSQNIIGEYNKVYIDEISLFPNLEEITIKNLGLTNENMQLLKTIKKINFINCEINGLKNLENVTELVINNTEIWDFENIQYLKNIEILRLINIDIKDFNFIEQLHNLKELAIENIPGFTLEKIDIPLNIEKISFFGINKLDLKIISKYKNLKEISVDAKDVENIKNELHELKKQNINILLNNLYEYKE